MVTARKYGRGALFERTFLVAWFANNVCELGNQETFCTEIFCWNYVGVTNCSSVMMFVQLHYSYDNININIISISTSTFITPRRFQRYWIRRNNEKITQMGGSFLKHSEIRLSSHVNWYHLIIVIWNTNCNCNVIQ